MVKAFRARENGYLGEYVHEVAWIYDFLVDLALPQRGSYRLSIVMDATMGF